MRSVAVTLSLIFGVCALFLIVKSYRDSTNVTISPNDPSSLPSPSKSGPHPKAVLVGGDEFDFGIMEQGQESQHVFVIRNDGEAPLRLAANYQGANTCECTVGSLERDLVPPGETVNVTVSWGIKKPVVGFAHSARIRTNDPDHVTIPLVIKGVIGRRAVILPSTNWSIGQLDSDGTVEVDLTLHSEISDQFKLLKIENPSGRIVTKSQALDAEELKALGTADLASPADKEKIDKAITRLKAGARRPLPKAGYKITATVDSSKFVSGPFLETLTFYTDLSEDHEISFHIRGSRSGMIEFMRTPGNEWDSKNLVLRLGTFSAAKGKSVRIPMLVKGVTGDGEIRIKSVKPKFLEINFERDTKFPAKKNRRYWMTLTVPKGKPPIVLTTRRHGEVVLELDGDTKRSMRFFIGFVSR